MRTMDALVEAHPSSAPKTTYSLSLFSYTDVSEANLHASLSVTRDGDASTALRLDGQLPAASFEGWWETFQTLSSEGPPEGVACILDETALRDCHGTTVQIWAIAEAGDVPEYHRSIATFDADTNSEEVPALVHLKKAMRYIWDYGQAPDFFTPTATKEEIGYPL